MARRTPSAINLLIGVDKPCGCSSHDMVARARRALGERRVGHAGTLDPLASGVLVLGVGQATRLLGRLALDEKSYLARIRFGWETSTDDAEGEPGRRAANPPELVDPGFAAEAVSRFVGPQMQVPPAFSAISVDGVRSYKRARAGEDVELAARPIDVRAALVLDVEREGDDPVWTVAFTVSKGTYIRALARDIARSIGAAAHLSSLRRTSSGCVTLSDCLDATELDPARAAARAIDPARALGMPAVSAPARALDDVLCGRALPVARVEAAPALADGASAALAIDGELRALVRREGERLVMTSVFPQGIGGVRP